MKTTIKLFALAFVALFAVSCNNNDEYDMLNSLWRNVTQNEARIDDLEKWCSQANTNITSLQTIVEAMKNNETINSMTPIIQEGDTIGYVIDFGTNGPITIYDDSHPANAPQIGVKEYGGTYYWTLNGEWLLDADGNKLRVSGQDGAAGADGNDGQNGQDGTDGQDGITPQLKIEADYWYISYDNGNTWTQLGKAKGDKGDTGATGAAGADGQDGDSMFQSVTQDAANVYFTLADGTLITIAKGDNTNYLYTITYMPNGSTSEAVVDTVRYGCSYTIKSCTFSYPEYGFVEWNTSADGKGVTYFPAESIVVMKNIILYAQWSDCVENGYVWIDLGLSVKWATRNVGALSPIETGNYFAWGETEPKMTYDWNTYKWCNGSESTLTKYNKSSSYGTVDNKTVLDPEDDAARANWGGAWRMPTHAELLELCNNCTWTSIELHGTYCYRVTGPNGNSIFFPQVKDGAYWSRTLRPAIQYYAFSMDCKVDNIFISGSAPRCSGRFVRAVID